MAPPSINPNNVQQVKASVFDIGAALKNVFKTAPATLQEGATGLKDLGKNGGGAVATLAMLPVKLAGATAAVAINSANYLTKTFPKSTVVASVVAVALVANKWYKSSKANNALESEQLNAIAQQGAARNSMVSDAARTDEFARLENVLAQSGKQNVGKFTGAHLAGKSGQQIGQQIG